VRVTARIINPCGDCEKRHVGCHSECELYKQYAEDRKRFKEAYIKSLNFEYTSYARKNRTKMLHSEKINGKKR